VLETAGCPSHVYLPLAARRDRSMSAAVPLYELLAVGIGR
jgi:hypothetical protein